MRVFVESLSGEIISDYCFKGYIGAVNADLNKEWDSLKSVEKLTGNE